jgi:hypothetical protein
MGMSYLKHAKKPKKTGAEIAKTYRNKKNMVLGKDEHDVPMSRSLRL